MYIPNNGNWVFHSDLGWLYAQSIAQDSFWLYDEDLGWLYTSKTFRSFFLQAFEWWMALSIRQHIR